MKALYEKVLARELVHEGGWSNHPKDPGGATMKGVTQAVYDGYRRLNKLPIQSVRKITTAELRAIYRQQYADKIAFDDLPAGVDYVVLDGAINSGPSRSVKWLQQALGVRADGVLANATLDAVKSYEDHDALIERILDLRMTFLRHLSTWPTFGKGWTARVDEVRKGGQAWASGSVPSPAEYHENGEAKALVQDFVVPAAPIGGPVVGSGGGGLAAITATAHQQLQPLVDSGNAPPVILYVLAGLTVLGVVVAGAGVLYGLYAKHRVKRVNQIIDPDGVMAGTVPT